MTDLKLNSLKFGIAGGIIGAITVFLTTINGILGLSNAASFMTTTLWQNLGYSVTWPGAFIGLIIGFVYGFVPLWLGALIYNKLI
jgi:hypothetical protein